MASATISGVDIKQEPGTENLAGSGVAPPFNVKQEPGTEGSVPSGGEGTGQGPAMSDEEVNEAAQQLAMENERLQQVLLGLQERQAVLEEFIEVEYGDRFDKFMSNRDRLVNVMGLNEGENTVLLDGKRTAKSHELVGLLKVVKERCGRAPDPPHSPQSPPRTSTSRSPPKPEPVTPTSSPPRIRFPLEEGEQAAASSATGTNSNNDGGGESASGSFFNYNQSNNGGGFGGGGGGGGVKRTMDQSHHNNRKKKWKGSKGKRGGGGRGGY